MFIRLASAFIIIPFIEIYLLMEIGSYIGPLATISIVILTGIAGAALARSQGVQVFANIQRTLSQGQMPQHELIEGLLIFVGGITLLTPGFVTDFVGLSLLFPPSRKLYAKRLLSYAKSQMQEGQWKVVSQSDVIDVTPD